MELKHLNKDEFEQAVNAGDELVVVDFFATWCGPCKMLGPVIERAADKFSDVHFYKVDIDEEMDLAARFQVMSVPTLIYFKRGRYYPNQSVWFHHQILIGNQQVKIISHRTFLHPFWQAGSSIGSGLCFIPVPFNFPLSLA